LHKTFIVIRHCSQLVNIVSRKSYVKQGKYPQNYTKKRRFIQVETFHLKKSLRHSRNEGFAS
jgi:hypothetical protein